MTKKALKRLLIFVCIVVLGMMGNLVSSNILALQSSTVKSADWPQLQGNAERHGRSSESIEPPYRARWVWLGPDKVLRNKASNPGWNDDLTTRSGYSYPMPQSVAFTIADSVQPIVSGGSLFVGTMEGKAYGINSNDGSTLWSSDIPGGTSVSAAVFESVVVFVTHSGGVYGFDKTNGSKIWSYQCRKSITTAPCIANGNVYIADHYGNVYSLNALTGILLWKTRLPAPVEGGIAVSEGSLYVGAENMIFYALNTQDGSIRVSRKVRGQSFKFTHPVVYNGQIFVQTAPVPIKGNEYVMDDVLADSNTLEEEENNVLRWLKGDSNNGRWKDASPDWQHLYVLRTTDLSEPFTVANGPIEGCGMAPEPVCIDNQGRILTWWKTRFPKLTGKTAFGTPYSVDLAGINPLTGKRVVIDNGHLSNMWLLEVDNLYALSVAGDYVWMRQNFRGTQVLNLKNSTNRLVVSEVRNRDGGVFLSDIVYADTPDKLTGTNQTPFEGRSAPAIAGGRVYVAESYGITAIEHVQ